MPDDYFADDDQRREHKKRYETEEILREFAYKRNFPIVEQTIKSLIDYGIEIFMPPLLTDIHCKLKDDANVEAANAQAMLDIKVAAAESGIKVTPVIKKVNFDWVAFWSFQELVNRAYDNEIMQLDGIKLEILPANVQALVIEHSQFIEEYNKKKALQDRINAIAKNTEVTVSFD